MIIPPSAKYTPERTPTYSPPCQRKRYAEPWQAMQAKRQLPKPERYRAEVFYCDDCKAFHLGRIKAK